MATRPTTHRARGLARREALLRAAVEIVAERGVGGATHRSIAERAGVPASTTTYFFSSIDELIIAALKHYTDERVAQLNDLSVLLSDNDEADPKELSLLFAQILCAAPWQYEIAQYELYLDASRRDTTDRSAVLEILSAFEGVAVEALKTIGCPNPEQIAPIFVAMADGYGLRRIGIGKDLNPEPLADAYYRLFLSYTAEPANLPASELPSP